MFFATTNPAFTGRQTFRQTSRSIDRFLDEAQQVRRQQNCAVEQDEKSFTLSFDVPGISREQLTIGIEGSVVRIQSKDDAQRKYRAAYELPTELDVANSQAKLENGVLTLKLAKLVPVSKASELVIN